MFNPLQIKVPSCWLQDFPHDRPLANCEGNRPYCPSSSGWSPPQARQGQQTDGLGICSEFAEAARQLYKNRRLCEIMPYSHILNFEVHRVVQRCAPTVRPVTSSLTSSPAKARLPPSTWFTWFRFGSKAWTTQWVVLYIEHWDALQAEGPIYDKQHYTLSEASSAQLRHNSAQQEAFIGGYFTAKLNQPQHVYRTRLTVSNLNRLE